MGLRSSLVDARTSLKSCLRLCFDLFANAFFFCKCLWYYGNSTAQSTFAFCVAYERFKKTSFPDVYSLCVAYPEPLADKLYSETKKFLEEHVAATLVKVKSGGEQNLLGNYHAAWEEFSR